MTTRTRRTLRRAWANLALISLLVTAGLGAYYLQKIHDIAEKNTQARRALCALRDDLDKRIEGSQNFLDEHPNGIPGIPASLIRQGLSNSRRTRETLEVLDCKEAT